MTKELGLEHGQASGSEHLTTQLSFSLPYIVGEKNPKKQKHKANKKRVFLVEMLITSKPNMHFYFLLH